MVAKHIVQLIDDIDASEAAETIVFAIDGATYEIDLSAEHAAQLRDALAVYVANARRAPSRGPPPHIYGRGWFKSGLAGRRHRSQRRRQWSRPTDACRRRPRSARDGGWGFGTPSQPQCVPPKVPPDG